MTPMPITFLSRLLPFQQHALFICDIVTATLYKTLLVHELPATFDDWYAYMYIWLSLQEYFHPAQEELTLRPIMVYNKFPFQGHFL